MAEGNVAQPRLNTFSGKPDPVVRQITPQDVGEALAAGIRDFQKAPLYGLAWGLLYALGGILVVATVSHLGVPYLAYPLAAGFVLIGPFVAAGLYEASRRMERGERPRFGDAWRALKSRPELRWMAFVSIFMMIVWMYQVRLLMALFVLGSGQVSTFPEFLSFVLTTNEGLLFLAIGNVVGAILALILFSLTVVSFPLVLERDVDFVTAMVTSVRSVAKNPVPMIGWAAVVVALLFVSAIPLFLGLVITLPVLGHTTWHLYRRLVAPDGAAA